MGNWLRAHPTVIVIAAAVILCSVMVVPLVIDALRIPSSETLPLAAVVVQSGDLSSGYYARAGQSDLCDQFLVMPAPEGASVPVPGECYQVEYTAAGGTDILLNAIWIYALDVVAEDELILLERLTSGGSLGNTELCDLPPLGDRQSASMVTLSGGGYPLHVTNLYWRSGRAVVRLTRISRQEHSCPDLVGLAQAVQARLGIR